jgi:hypothetical protein
MAQTRWWQYETSDQRKERRTGEPVVKVPMPAKKRVAWAIVLIVFAVIFVFAVWPLHANVTRDFLGSSNTTSTNCGSALFAHTGGVTECNSAVGHRRAFLLALGSGGVIVALFGVHLAFAAKESGQSRDDSPADSDSDGDSVAGIAEMSAETLDKLERLGRLRTSGVLTDEEFAAEKAKLLG